MSSSKVGAVGASSPAAVSASSAVARTPRAGGGGAQSYPGGGSGSLEITGVANRLAALEEELRNNPAIDEARVAAIRLALEQGTYAISAQHIAERLARMELVLKALAGEKS